MKNEIVKLLEDRDFVQKLMTREDVEDVKKLFKNKGVEVSDSDINELGEIMNEIVETLGKMSEEELRAICGGGYKDKNGKEYEIPDYKMPLAHTLVRISGVKPEILKETESGMIVGRTPHRDIIQHYESSGSKYKDFIGNNANEIAVSILTLTAATAIVGGAYGIKKGIRWYRRNYSK